MKKFEKIKGVVTTPPTVFNSEGEIDKEKSIRYIRHLINEGVHGIFVPGSAGEYGLMTMPQRKEMIAIGVEAAGGKVPVLAGTQHDSTKLAIELSKYAEEVGADAAMAALPHDPKPTQEGLYQHYKAISEAVNIPVYAYNWPRQFGLEIEPETVARLAKDGYLQGIKDAADDLWHIAEVIRLTEGKISVLAGIDATALGALCLGADGTMSSVADLVPAEVVKMYNLFKAGKIEEAAKQQLSLLGLYKALCIWRDRDNLQLLREANRMLGNDIGDSPLPTTKEFVPDAMERIREALKKIGRL